MIVQLALGNLVRNRWRTVLTVAGVATAVSLLVWTLAYMEGFAAELVLQTTEVELGQVTVQSRDYADRAAVRHSFELTPQTMERIQAVEGVVSVAPRVIAWGLVGHEDKSIVSKIVGVDPGFEAQTTIVKDGLIQGRWLAGKPPEYPAPREAIVGRNFAQQLGIGVGDELVTFFEAADGALGNDLLKIVGIVETRNSMVDRQTVFTHLSDMQYTAGLDGQVNELAIRLEHVSAAQAAARRISIVMSDPDIWVRPWQKMAPEMHDMVQMMDRTDVIMFVLVYLIVAFGLFNAQRMSALERTREFGVMRAIGVTPWQLFFTVILESVFITLLGGIIGVGLGWLLSYPFVVSGLDLAAWSDDGQGMGMLGIKLEKLMFVINAKVLLKPLVYIVPVAFLCGLWPAYKATRLEITSSISGRI